MSALFWVPAIVLVASALWTVTASKSVYSVVALLVNFAALAVLFLSLSAEFLAMIQIIVYSGAILILFLFVIALLSSGVAPLSLGPNRLPRIAAPAAIALAVALGLVIAGVAVSHGASASHAIGAAAPAGTGNSFGSVADFGRALFMTYLLPFEITALILMVAVIGVIVLAGDETPYVASRERAQRVRKEMREAIAREGD
ncbi:MAG: NADH-quinone oxidoreductase subunit J family protein [Candidatus Tyrphobacter sp.]